MLCFERRILFIFKLIDYLKYFFITYIDINKAILTNQLRTIRKQILFATAQTLTSTVLKIENAQKVTLRRNSESPTPSAVKGIKNRGARKSDIRAKVFVMNITLEYLTPFEKGVLIN